MNLESFEDAIRGYDTYAQVPAADRVIDLKITKRDALRLYALLELNACPVRVTHDGAAFYLAWLDLA